MRDFVCNCEEHNWAARSYSASKCISNAGLFDREIVTVEFNLTCKNGCVSSGSYVVNFYD